MFIRSKNWPHLCSSTFIEAKNIYTYGKLELEMFQGPLFLNDQKIFRQDWNIQLPILLTTCQNSGTQSGLVGLQFLLIWQNIYIFLIFNDFNRATVIHKNNRDCDYEINNRMTVAVIWKWVVLSRLRLFAPSLLSIDH